MTATFNIRISHFVIRNSFYHFMVHFSY
jgi:hypothetical protein